MYIPYRRPYKNENGHNGGSEKPQVSMENTFDLKQTGEKMSTRAQATYVAGTVFFGLYTAFNNFPVFIVLTIVVVLSRFIVKTK